MRETVIALFLSVLGLSIISMLAPGEGKGIRLVVGLCVIVALLVPLKNLAAVFPQIPCFLCLRIRTGKTGRKRVGTGQSLRRCCRKQARQGWNRRWRHGCRHNSGWTERISESAWIRFLSTANCGPRKLWCCYPAVRFSRTRTRSALTWRNGSDVSARLRWNHNESGRKRGREDERRKSGKRSGRRHR